jgi:amino acid adenylation domain-containing protein
MPDVTLEAGMETAAFSRTVLDGFDVAAARLPGETAVTCGDSSLTYAELDGRANRTARRLIDLGAGPETVVGICLPRGLDLAVAVLGVLKSGAAYLPLEPDYPDERLRTALTDSSAVALLAERDVADRLAVTRLGIPALRPDTEAADAPTRPATGPDSLQYVIYTSGSTGRPKGIAMQHGPQVTLLDWCVGRYRDRPVALQYFPITTDVASVELLSAWWAGGELVIATERDRYDIATIADLIERHSISKILLPVAAMQELARHAVGSPAALEGLRSLRELITTGDRLAITPEIRRMCDALPGISLDDHYGSTEVNVVTAPRLTAPCDQWPSRPLHGTPICEARIYVLDDQLNQVPRNVVGEIYVAGGSLARGYLGLPPLTAAAFLPDPFSPVPGARMYRMGDLGRWRADPVAEPGREGLVLECLGRADFQIKLHGYRIEPGEIEELLRAREDVDEAVVVARYGDAAGAQGGQDSGEGVLIAYVVPVAWPGQEPPQPGTLRDYLAASLPSYMVPSTFMLLDSLPMTGSGKVDRRGLPDPGPAEPPFMAPRDELESTIAKLWADSLGLEDVGIKHNFFALGGHSLVVTQIVYQLRESLGVNVPLAVMLKNPTVESFAAQVRALLTAKAGAAT